MRLSPRSRVSSHLPIPCGPYSPEGRDIVTLLPFGHISGDELIPCPRDRQCIKHVYFISKVFKYAEARYPKIEKIALAVVVAEKTKTVISGSQDPCKSQLSCRQVLKKSGLAGRVVTWEVELSKSEIQYVPRGSIE